MRWEHWRFTAPLRLRSILRRSRLERELDEELQFHLDRKTEEGIAGGLSPREARFAALRAMGGLAQRKEEIRDSWHVHWFTDFFADLHYALRSLRRTPGLTAVVAITIALGIGMTAAPFSMLDALIFRPYPVPRPGDVVTLVTTSPDDGFGQFSYREYLDIRGRAKSYSGVVASTALQAAGFSAGRGATPVIRGAMLVSGNYFRILGVAPRLGRGFREEEDTVPGRHAVVVLAPGFWQRDFDSDPSVVGRTIQLNGVDFTVIGVAPDSFPGMLIFSRPDFYVPLAMARVFTTTSHKDFFADRDDRELTVRARLERATTLPQARHEMAVLARGFEREFPAFNRSRSASVHTQIEMRTRDDEANWKFSVIFTLLSVAVLLVACTNAAGLLLSRARSRTREVTVRLALGAGRFRLVRLLLAESLVLASLGGVGGVALGYFSITLLQRFSIPTELPVTIPFRMDTRVLAASAAMVLLSALFCGLAPALQSTRTGLVTGLKASGADPGGRHRLWGRNALVVAQIAMSLMLLAASFLMVRGFEHSLDAGVASSTDHLLMVKFDPRLLRYNDARTQQFYTLLSERVRETPGVRSAAFTLNPPLGLDDFDTLSFVPEDFPMPRDRDSLTAAMDTVDEDFFRTMGVPLARGRGFLPSDSAAAPRVAVVNEHFARRYWPDADAIGKRFRLDGRAGTPVEIVGIAQTVKYQATFERSVDFVYLPVAQRPAARRILLLRSTGDPLQLVQPVKEIVRRLDPNMPLLETRTYQDLYRYAAVEGPRVAINLVGSMGAVGLLLAVTGLYGLVAYNVSRRTREIGIRIAIGAARSDVMSLVLGNGLRLVGSGAALGLAMGFAVERLLNFMLFHRAGIDIVIYAVALPSLFLVAMAAAWVPARKATRIAPIQALRYE